MTLMMLTRLPSFTFMLAPLIVVILSIVPRCNADTLVVGTQDLHYFPHYDFTSDTDKGLAWAILQAFAEASDHELVYVPMPVLRLQKELAKGSVDLIYPDNPKWYNPVMDNAYKTFSAPLTQALGGTIMRQKYVGAGIDQIKRLAMPLGFTPVNWQKRVDERLTHLIRVNNTLNALELIVAEKADAANLEYHVVQHIAGSNPWMGSFTLDPRLPYDDVSFMLATIHHSKVINEFNAFMASQPQQIKALHQHYKMTPPKVIIEQLIAKFY